jgi:hypothetical protein
MARLFGLGAIMNSRITPMVTPSRVSLCLGAPSNTKLAYGLLGMSGLGSALKMSWVSK